MRKNIKIIISCTIIAAICFAIVSYGHFYRGRIGLGILFAVLTLAQIVMVIINYNISKKINK